MKSPLFHFLIALLISGIAISIYGVCYATISNKSREVAALQDQITTATETTTRITRARAILATIAGDEARVQSYFVPETAVVTLINTLETLGSTQGASVSILSVSTGGSLTQPTLLFSLSIKGTFDTVMRTIGSIEYAPYAISISNVSIQKDVTNSWKATFKMSVMSLPTGTKTTTL